MDFNYKILTTGVKVEHKTIKKILKISSLADGIINPSRECKQESMPSENILIKFLPPFTFILFYSFQTHYVVA